MIKLTTNNAIITVVLGLVCLTIIFLVIVPSVNDILGLSKEIKTQRMALEEMYERGQSLRKTQEQFKKIKPNINQIENILLTQGQELDFITSLEAVAANNKIEQDIQLNIKDIEQTNGDYTIPVRLNLAGAYKDIIGYLIDLEKLDYYLNFTNLSVNNEGTSIAKSGFKFKTAPAAESATKVVDKLLVIIEATSYWQTAENKDGHNQLSLNK